MSFDLYGQEAAERISSIPAVKTPEPGAFDGFFSGTGRIAMRTMAAGASGLDLAGAVGPILQDKITGGTEAQDRYFKEHDEVFNRAVDFWTPKPGEVGAAAEVTGQLLSMLPMVIASPALAVGALQLSTGEDLIRKGVDAGKAQAVGAVHAAGLGLGIWMPMLGQNLWQRVVVGGAGFNVAQGVATRGASGKILEGTPAEGDFKAFDGQQLTLDVLLGAAFGGITHLSPAQRAQGAAAWERIGEWAKNLKPSEVDALATLRQAQHLNVDSAPGRPEDLPDVEAHVQRMRTAVDQLVKDQPVSVENMPAPRFELDPKRQAEAEAGARMLSEIADDQTLRASLSDTDYARLTEGLRKNESVGHTLEILSLYDRAVAKDIPGNERHAVRFGLVDDAAAARIKEQIGLDVAGYRHSLDNQFINKVLKDHGSEATEAPRGQIPVTREDIARVPEIVAAPDRIEQSGESSYGAKLVRYVKRFNGTTYYVEEARRGRGELAAKTMWKTPSREPMLPDGPQAPTSETLGRNLPQDGSVAHGADEGRSPLSSEAARFAQDNPNFRIHVGKDAEGGDITMSAREYLDQADLDVRQAAEDAKLFEVAAGCILGAF